jgi:PAS domain S-box-containing protein
MIDLACILAGALGGFALLSLLWSDVAGAARDLIFQLFTSTTAPLLVLDARGRILEASASAGSLLGRDAAGLRGLALGALFGQELQPGGLSQARALALPGPAQRVLELRASPLDQGGHYVLNLRDLSAQRWAEAAREREERFFRALLEHSLDGVAVLDPKGEVLYHSPSAGAAQALGPAVFRGLATSEQARWQALLGRLHGQTGVVEAFEFSGAGGRHYEALVQFSGALERPAFVVNYRDITERRRTEEALLRFEHLATADELGATLAHELRNPIMGIQATVEGLQTDPELSPGAREDLALVQQQVQRLQDLLNQTLGKGPRRPPDLVDLVPLLKQSLELAQRGIGPAHHKVALELDLPAQLLVPGDAGQIQQVLLNLLLNAYQAQPQGGRLRVSAAAAGGGARVSVADEGPGISVEPMERIFEPFFTTKPDGNGIGLAVSRRIAVAHGGHLDVQRLPQGTAFHLRLPTRA